MVWCGVMWCGEVWTPSNLPVGTHASGEAPFEKTSVSTDHISKYGALRYPSAPIQKGPWACQGHQSPKEQTVRLKHM